MAEKYVATIMKRIYSKDRNYLYVVSHPAIGTVDEETNIFKDVYGNEYLPMQDKNLLLSEITDAYYNIIELSRIKDYMQADSIEEAISEYATVYGRILHYVTTENEMSMNIRLNLDMLKNGAIEGMMHQANINVPKDTPEETENETEELIPRILLGSEISEEVTDFIQEIVEGEYSTRDLKTIKDIVKNQKVEIESLLETIDLQLEANDSSVLSDDKPPEITNHIDINDIYKKVTKTLIAQDEPARRVIVEIARKLQSQNINKRGLLVTGLTGVGKTKLMTLIAKYINRPFIKIDSTRLTSVGYVGDDIEEKLWELYISCDRDINRTENAIVFFDEIDKKGSSRKDDIAGTAVLNSLLPFIEGSSYYATPDVKTKKEVVKINTKNMIVILGGAFEDVYKNLKNKTEVGFGRDIDSNQKDRKAKVEDFINNAMMTGELMGRVSIIKLNDLEINDLKRILNESDESAIKIQEKLFEELGVKLTVGSDYIEEIATQAYERKTGARGINNVVDESTWEAYADVYSNVGQYEEIVLSKETVDNPKQYKKIYKTKKEGRLNA